MNIDWLKPHEINVLSIQSYFSISSFSRSQNSHGSLSIVIHNSLLNYIELVDAVGTKTLLTAFQAVFQSIMSYAILE